MRHLFMTTALGLILAAAPAMAQDNQNKMQNQDATQGQQTQDLIQQTPSTQGAPEGTAEGSAQTGQSGSSGQTAGQDQPDTTAGSPSPTDKSTQSTAQDEQKPGAEGTTGTAQAPADQTGQPEQTAGMDKTRASELIGTSVQNAQGENVGEINDILLAEDGSASQVLIGVGGFLGLGEKSVAVDFSELNFGAEGEVSIAMSAEALEQQPAYQEEETSAGTSAQPEQNQNTEGASPEGGTNQPK